MHSPPDALIIPLSRFPDFTEITNPLTPLSHPLPPHSFGKSVQDLKNTPFKTPLIPYPHLLLRAILYNHLQNLQTWLNSTDYPMLKQLNIFFTNTLILLLLRK